MTDYGSANDQGFIGELDGDLPPRETKASFKAAKSSARAAAASAKEAAEVALGEARERVQALAGETARKVQYRYGDLEAWVQLKPARALGVAAGIGVLLGLLLRGRSTRVVYLRDH